MGDDRRGLPVPSSRIGHVSVTPGSLQRVGSPMTVCFGPYRLDPREARLTRDGEAVALRPKAFELLVALIGQPNVLVTKDELLDRVWGTRFVTEGVVKSIVGELRDALGDDPRTPRWIETVPRRGYRFVGAVGAVDTHPVTVSSADGNVPPAETPPIGRDEALRVATALHDTHRLLTIAGPSGVGKTRLALALAGSRRDAWRDGVWFVELASMATGSTDVAALSAGLAQLLRLDGTAGANAANLARALRPLALLLVLDNAEHLLEPVATLVEALLAGAPGLRIVVTSQEPLGLPGEQVYRVAPLTLPEPADDADGRRLMQSSAVQLFVARVAGRVQGFTLAADQQAAVATICRALDGMPLALELAAARVPLLGVHGIADLLLGDDHDARLQLLTGGTRTAAPRQRTLRNAIAWSYALLDVGQQAVLRRLGVFRGGFSLAAAQAVCSDDTIDPWFVLDAMNALVDKSLLVALDASAGRRFRLLESLRTFALERLAEAGEDTATRDRHLAAVVDYWSLADDEALGEPSLAWTERHLVELGNLRAALRWADGRGNGHALRTLVAQTSHFWSRTGLGGEGRAWCDAARKHAPAADPVLDARFDLAIATLALYANAYRAADIVGSMARVVDAFDEAGDSARSYYALYLLFQLSLRCQAPIDGAAVLARMRSLEGPAWSDVLKRFRRSADGYARRLAGDASGYGAYCRDELVLCRRIGAIAESWIAAQGLMLAELDMGRIAEAVVIADDAVDEIRAAGRLRQYPAFLALRATMLAERGDVARARTALDEALPVLDGAGTRWMAHVALAWLVAHDDGRHDDAARVVGRHRAAVESGSASGSGVYVGRVLDALCERLTRALGADAFARCLAEGAMLDDGQVERLVMGDAQGDPRERAAMTGR